MELVKILWRLLKPFKREIGVYLVLIIFYELFQLADSYIIKLVIDFLVPNFSIAIFAAFLIAVLVFDELFRFWDRRTDWQIVVRLLDPVYQYFKRTTLGKLMDMEMSWHYKQRSGTLMGKVQDGTGKVLNMVTMLSWEFVPTLVQVIVSLIALVIVRSFLIAGVIALSFVAFWLVTILQQRVLAPLWKKRHDLYEDEWGRANETVSLVETVSLYNQRPRLLADHGIVLSEIRSTSEREAELWIHRYGRWRQRVQGLARRVVLTLLAIQVVQGVASVGTMVFVWTITERLFHAFWRFARLYDESLRSLESAKRLEGIMGLKPSLVSPGDPKEVPLGPVRLDFENVTFSYSGNGGENIRNLSTAIQAGETVGVVGPSGAGKTTLRRLLTRAWDVTAGRVLVNGVDVRDVSLEELRGVFSYVPQGDEVAIFNESFTFNIAFGRPGANFSEIKRAAELAGIAETIESAEKGYDTLLGERGLRLSGGQKQRVALARAILADRPVLILDEATSSVDAITEDEIQERLLPIFKDKERTVLVIAHNLSTLLGVVDRILVFNRGELVEEGTHEELLRKDGLYARLFAHQFAKVLGRFSQGLVDKN